MRVSSAILCGSATLALLSACSTGNPQPHVAAGAEAPFVDVAAVTAANGNETIVSDNLNSVVSVFNGGGRVTARITAGISQPTGIATDAAEQLYIANSGAGNILVYAKPYTAVTLTLADTVGEPLGVAVSGAGVVGVTNGGLGDASGSVSLYAKGSAKACVTVANNAGLYPQTAAFDAAGNLFVLGNHLVKGRSEPFVAEISGGCSATSVAMLRIGNVLAQPTAIGVRRGSVLIADEPVGNPGPVLGNLDPVIYTYGPPANGSLGAPLIVTKLTQGITTAAFALSRNGNRVWIVHSGLAAGRIEYTFPDGRFITSQNQAAKGSIFTPGGIAVNPPAIP
jgi:hypothetical protein